MFDDWYIAPYIMGLISNFWLSKSNYIPMCSQCSRYLTMILCHDSKLEMVKVKSPTLYSPKYNHQAIVIYQLYPYDW